MSYTEFLIGPKTPEAGLQPLTVTGLYPETDIFLFQQVRHRHGVSIEIIARANQPYTHIMDNPKGFQEGIFTGVVPDRSAYIQLTKTGTGDLSEFWGEVERLREEQRQVIKFEEAVDEALAEKYPW